MKNIENPTTTHQKKSYQTRLKIMNAYIELMKHKNFDAITVKSIVEKANITRGTFYLYFTDIYEMTTYIEDTLLSDMPSTPEFKKTKVDKCAFPTYEECSDNGWEQAWFEYYNCYHVPFNTLLGPHGDALFYGKIKKCLQNALLIRMQQDDMPNDSRRNYFMELLPDLYLMLAKEWTSSNHLDNLDIDSILSIISTIRIGSLYKHSLECRIAQNKNMNTEV